jgi:serine/threonine protein kinase
MRKTIGSGGYGVVVSAMDRRSETKVAIKKVVNAFDDVLVAKRMVREIRLLRQVREVAEAGTCVTVTHVVGYMRQIGYMQV